MDREHVGGRSKAFIEKMKEALGFRATGRKIICKEERDARYIFTFESSIIDLEKIDVINIFT